MHYRLGWPLGRTVASFGVPTLIRIIVIKDAEAGVFVGTSKDLVGLVIEAESIEALIEEAHDVIPVLLGAQNGNHWRKEIISSVRYNDCLPNHA